ncbi:MAG: hypothetical protein HY055_17665 [Magnetospirillum sp.]|nr:hypothetical protein [Magnetospirillum sp.]
MNATERIVIALRPESHGSQRHLALVLHNGAGRAKSALDVIRVACADFVETRRDQAELAAAAGLLSSDLEAIQAQIDHCLDLWRELKDG